jgi:hypothetical protein
MKRMVLLAGILAFMLMVGPASAAIVIDFEEGSVTGGTITSAGVGTNIPVDIMKVIIDGGPSTQYDLFGAGPNSSIGGDTNGSALVNFNTATGVFTIVGGVCVAGNNTCNGGAGTLVQSTTLVNGTGSSVTIVSFSSTTLDFREPDTKDPTLLRALGIPLDINFALMDATFQYSSANGSSPWTVNSVDIQNTGVPEPTSIVLLGTLLVGVTQLVRRRVKA